MGLPCSGHIYFQGDQLPPPLKTVPAADLSAQTKDSGEPAGHTGGFGCYAGLHPSLASASVVVMVIEAEFQISSYWKQNPKHLTFIFPKQQQESLSRVMCPSASYSGSMTAPMANRNLLSKWPPVGPQVAAPPAHPSNSAGSIQRSFRQWPPWSPVQRELLASEPLRISCGPHTVLSAERVRLNQTDMVPKARESYRRVMNN